MLQEDGRWAYANISFSHSNATGCDNFPPTNSDGKAPSGSQMSNISKRETEEMGILIHSHVETPAPVSTMTFLPEKQIQNLCEKV